MAQEKQHFYELLQVRYRQLLDLYSLKDGSCRFSVEPAQR
jgi:hypothetical protein